MSNKKVIFLTHKKLLRSEITGGVQLCSQEFLQVVTNCRNFSVSEFHVGFTRRLTDRIRIKLGWENYSMYDVDKEKDDLLELIRKDGVEVVFINMSSAMRYAKPVKEEFGKKVKVILLSHGNHSGDFLHLIGRPVDKTGDLKKWIKKFRLGMLISTESDFRIHYLDGVVAISETERQIENWLNAKQTLFFPRLLKQSFLDHQPQLSRIGFVGRLDHPPNLQGIALLCDAFKNTQMADLRIRLVGAPVEYGKQLAAQYPFIDYLGEYSDDALEQEAATWSFFLNPVWWYSTGASTKLGKGISWGIPIVSTTAGMRGYQWSSGKLLVADTPSAMCAAILDAVKSKEKIIYWASQTKEVASHGPSIDELSMQLEALCQR